MFTPRIGTALPNGALILAATSTMSGILVLARWGNEFVTWRVSDHDGEAYWGRYFDNVVDATNNYVARGGVK